MAVLSLYNLLCTGEAIILQRNNHAKSVFEGDKMV